MRQGSSGRRFRVRKGAAAVLLAAMAAPGGFAQQTGQLVASPLIAAPGGGVTAIWTGTQAPTSPVRLYLYRAGQGGHSGWQWSTGAGHGSHLFVLSKRLPSDQYELRLYDEDGRKLLATSNRFQVDSAKPGFTVSPQLRAAGSLVSLNWFSLSEVPYWAALCPVGSATSDAVAWQATTGRVFGTIPFQLSPGLPEGVYEFRLFASDRVTLVATSNQLKVEPSVPNLTVGTVEVAPGRTLTVIWSGLRAAGARVRIYLYEVGDGGHSGWKWGGGVNSGSLLYDLPKRLAPGTYELRAYSEDGRTLLARSNWFTVDPEL